MHVAQLHEHWWLCLITSLVSSSNILVLDCLKENWVKKREKGNLSWQFRSSLSDRDYFSFLPLPFFGGIGKQRPHFYLWPELGFICEDFSFILTLSFFGNPNHVRKSERNRFLIQFFFLSQGFKQKLYETIHRAGINNNNIWCHSKFKFSLQ